MNKLMELFKLESWMNIWGLIIFVGLPLLFLFATFVYRRRKPKGEGIIPPQIVRFLMVPSLAVYLTLSKIVGFPDHSMTLKIAKTVVIIIIISFFFNAINYIFFSKNNFLTKKEIIPKLAQDLLHIILVSLAIAAVLSSIWGLDLGNLLTALGVSSLVIGLALQEPLGNLFNGVSLIMANPFKKGDWIEVGSEVGRVAEINWRSVKIHNRMNEQIIIPNNMLGKEKIKNLSRPSRIHAQILKFGFSYEDHPAKAKEVLLTIVQNNEKVLKSPKPVAITISYDDFAITYGLKFFINDYQDIIVLNDEIMSEVYTAANENGLTIPYPKQEVKIIK